MLFRSCYQLRCLKQVEEEVSQLVKVTKSRLEVSVKVAAARKNSFRELKSYEHSCKCQGANKLQKRVMRYDSNQIDQLQMCKYMCMCKPMSLQARVVKVEKVLIRPPYSHLAQMYAQEYSAFICPCSCARLSAPRAFHTPTTGSYHHTAILRTSTEPEHFITNLKELLRSESDKRYIS